MNIYKMVEDCDKRFKGFSNAPTNEKNSIIYVFGEEFKEFLNVLFNEYREQPYRRIVVLSKLPIIKVLTTNYRFVKEFCNYLNIPDYKDIGILLYFLIRKYNIEEYSNLSIGDLSRIATDYLGTKCFDYKNIELTGFKGKDRPNYSLEDYIKGVTPPKSWIYAECDAYIKEKEALEQYGLEDKVVFLSDSVGDGVGGDILSVVPDNPDIERIIEVKYSGYNTIKISYDEFKNAVNPLEGKEIEYLVIYYRKILNTIMQDSVFKYDKESNMFLNIKNSDFGFYVPNEFSKNNRVAEIYYPNGRITNSKREEAKILKFEGLRIVP